MPCYNKITWLGRSSITLGLSIILLHSNFCYFKTAQHRKGCETDFIKVNTFWLKKWFSNHSKSSPHWNLPLAPLQIVPRVAVLSVWKFGTTEIFTSDESPFSSMLFNLPFNSLLSSFDILLMTSLTCHFIISWCLPRAVSPIVMGREVRCISLLSSLSL